MKKRVDTGTCDSCRKIGPLHKEYVEGKRSGIKGTARDEQEALDNEELEVEKKLNQHRSKL